MSSKKITFRLVFAAFAIILAAAVAASLLYVRGLLRRYEASQPEKQVEAVAETLANEAENGTLWEN